MLAQKEWSLTLNVLHALKKNGREEFVSKSYNTELDN